MPMSVEYFSIHSFMPNHSIFQALPRMMEGPGERNSRKCPVPSCSSGAYILSAKTLGRMNPSIFNRIFLRRDLSPPNVEQIQGRHTLGCQGRALCVSFHAPRGALASKCLISSHCPDFPMAASALIEISPKATVFSRILSSYPPPLFLLIFNNFS